MNFAVIFAGGVGSRMGSLTPKQFLFINNKPVLAHTISIFHNSVNIDKIVVVTLEKYIKETKKIIEHYRFNKVIDIIPGGQSALESQFNGIMACHKHSSSQNDIVLIHDGVRPFINSDLIEKCVLAVKEKGTAITVSPAAETIAIKSGASIEQTLPRENCLIARAPQCFYLKDIYEAHLLAKKNKKTYIDSASMFLDQGRTLNPVMGPDNNIKITTPYDYELAKLLLGDKK